MRILLAFLVSLAVLAQPASANTYNPVCSLALNSTPGYINMTVSGLNPNTGYQTNKGGGPRNYYVMALNAPDGSQQADGVDKVTSWVGPFPYTLHGGYGGLVYYVIDNGTTAKPTLEATCKGTF